MSATSLGSLTVDMIANVGGFTTPMEKAERLTVKAMKAMGMAVDEFGNYTDKNMKKVAEALKRLDGQFEGLSANMQREIALYGETTRVMQMRYDLEKGALKDLSEAQKASLLQMSARLDAMDSANAAFRAGADESASSMRNMRGMAQNLGWQMQDVAVQLQAGTDAMVVFSQQGSQLASGFGPKGALIGALIAVGGAIAGVLFKSMKTTGDAMKEMTDRAKGLAAEMHELSAAQREVVLQAQGYTLSDMDDEYDGVTEAIATQIEKIAELKRTQGELYVRPGDMQMRLVARDNTVAIEAEQKALNALELKLIDVQKQRVKTADPTGYLKMIEAIAKENELIGLTGKALYEKEAAQKGYLEGQAREYVAAKLLGDTLRQRLEDEEAAAKAAADAQEAAVERERKRADAIEKAIQGLEREAALHGVNTKAAQMEYDILSGILEVQGGLEGVEGRRLMLAAQRADTAAKEAKMAESVEKTIEALKEEVKQLELGEEGWLAYQMQLNNATSAQIEEAVALKRRAQELRDASKDTKTGLSKDAKTMGDAYTAMWERVASKGADVFKSFMDGSETSFKGIGDAFKQMLAEMANQAALQPIMLRVQQSFPGASQSQGQAGTSGGGASSAMGAMGAGGMYAIAAVAVVAAVSSWNKKQDEKFKEMTAEFRQGNQSTGTLLGLANAKSQSINNVLEDMSGKYDDVLSVNYGMYRALLDIRAGVTAAAEGFVRTRIGSNNIESGAGTFSMMGWQEGKRSDFRDFIDKGLTSPVSDFILDFMDGLINKIGKEIFKKKIRVSDSGIQIFASSLAQLFDGAVIEAVNYLDITKEKKFLGVSISKEMETITEELDAMFLRQFTDIFINAGDALRTASEAFGVDFDALAGGLTIDAQKLSLKDLEGDALAKEIEAFFSSTLDNWAWVLLDGTTVLAEFQRVGEGAFETMIRLAAETKHLDEMLRFIGVSMGAVGLDSVYFTQSLADMAGGFDALSAQIGTYYDKFFTDQEKLVNLTSQLSGATAGLLDTLPGTHAEFRAIIEALDLSTEAGAAAFVELMALAPAMDAYITALQRQNEATRAGTELARFMRDFNDRIDTAYFDEFAMGVFRLNRALEDSIAKALELGATEEDLAVIRRASAFDMWELQQTETDRALAGLRASVDAEIAAGEERLAADIAALNAEFDARVASLDTWLETQLRHFERRIKAVSEAVKELSSLSGALADAIHSLRPSSEFMQGARYERAGLQVEALRASFLADGSLPTAELVKQLTQDLTGGADYYSSLEAFEDANAGTIQSLALLRDATDEQLSIEEQTLASLNAGQERAKENHERMMAQLQADRDAQVAALEQGFADERARLEAVYNTAVAQTNAIRGVDDSVKSVEEAVAIMREAVTAELAALRAADSLKYDEMLELLTQIAISTSETKGVLTRQENGVWEDVA